MKASFTPARSPVPVSASNYSFRTPTASQHSATAPVDTTAEDTSATVKSALLHTTLSDLAARKAALDAQLSAVQRAKEMRLSSLRHVDMSRQAVIRALPAEFTESEPLPLPPTLLAGTRRANPAGPSVGTTPPTAADPLARSSALLAASATAQQEALAVESVRAALIDRADMEAGDVLKLRSQLDRASEELELAHGELASKQGEVANLRNQLEHMVSVAAKLLSNVDPATAGALTMAVSAMQGYPATAGDVLTLTETVSREVAPEVREVAYRPLATPTLYHGVDVSESFESVMTKFDEWAKHHDAAVSMLQALPSKSI